MKTLTTAQERFGAPLPIMKYNFASGIRLAPGAGTHVESAPLPAGAYLITASADAFISVDRTAGDNAGSIFLGAGVPMHLLIEEGQRIFAAGGVLASSVFVVPLG